MGPGSNAEEKFVEMALRGPLRSPLSSNPTNRVFAISADVDASVQTFLTPSRTFSLRLELIGREIQRRRVLTDGAQLLLAEPLSVNRVD